VPGVGLLAAGGWSLVSSRGETKFRDEFLPKFLDALNAKFLDELTGRAALIKEVVINRDEFLIGFCAPTDRFLEL
jgi:hypothetical protein